MNPDAFCSIFCHKPEKLSAKLLGDLFTINCRNRLPGTDKTSSLDFWMGYLQETEGKKRGYSLSSRNVRQKSGMCIVFSKIDF